MNESDFVKSFLLPSTVKLEDAYSLPLPEILDLKKVADILIQGESDDSFMVNVVRKYFSESLGVMVREVYKNTQNTKSGVFVRLVGTIGFVKKGYPRLVVDAPVSNVSLLPGESKELKTRVFVVFPQAEPDQKEQVFGQVQKDASKDRIVLTTKTEKAGSPPSAYFVEAPGIDLDIIAKVRNYAWNAYRHLIERNPPAVDFDYRPILSERVFETAGKEARSFAAKGLSVPVEVQQAFFCATSGGIE